jgi:hypothetical protein
MPRAYDVNSISSDELRLNKIDFRIQLEHLEEEYANAFTRWSSLIRKNADQELIDREEKQYKNIQRQISAVFNKKCKADYELQRRIRLELR